MKRGSAVFGAAGAPQYESASRAARILFVLQPTGDPCKDRPIAQIDRCQVVKRQRRAAVSESERALYPKA